jgi:hypothetical protein
MNSLTTSPEVKSGRLALEESAKARRPAGKALKVSGRFVRVLSLRSEHFDIVEDPVALISDVKASVPGEILTFIQPVWDTIPRYPYHLEWYEVAVLRFDSYESWWKNRLNDKTRNMIRKAQKKGVEIRLCSLSDEFIKGIKGIYDESPLRQGKPFRHFGKDLATLRDAHITFFDRSEFIGAYFEGKLIGFIKLVYHGLSAASIMQIIAANAHRDKAPTNALLAKAVELCDAKGIHLLQYGMWSRRGLGEFKKHHCFERVKLPRYYVPLNVRGKIALRLRLYRSLAAIIPESWIDRMARFRSKWYSHKLGQAAD